MSEQTKKWIREMLAKHNGDVEAMARWLRDSCHAGGMKANRAAILEALQ
jgi:hypothetical protein